MSTTGEGPLAGQRVAPGLMRRMIIKKVTAAKQQVPHFYLWRQVEMDHVLARRQQHPDPWPSVTAYAVWAAARALAQHPRLNASVGENELVYHDRIHIGVAVALPDGLIVPVVRDADQLSPAEIHAAVQDLAERARTRRLRPEEYQGGTFSISNLGMYGVDGFAAIIQPPEAAILALGSVRPQWVKAPQGWGERMMMEATLSVDHRLVDGAPAAQFLGSFAAALSEVP